MQTEHVRWNWDGKDISLGMDRSGSGPSVLLLPALSSISTRSEMRPLQQRLNARYDTLAIDWPGFGDAPRPPTDWRPPAYAAFLDFLLRSILPKPHAVIAAGHAAGYALAHAAAHPGAFERLVLVAPTCGDRCQR
ncbi:MAG TPA: alpha/beta hydrolase [Bradyrhizobium sp.]|nr:alpha/beta hydrolase [Bradyrhizobium sp.]